MAGTSRKSEIQRHSSTAVSSRVDPLERRIENALRPGKFIHDRACFSFVADLREVAEAIRTLTPSEPARAADLCETFLAGCRAKAEQLDDSSGSFGMFAGDLICQWIEARQAQDANAEETVATLIAWMDDDPYAFCYQIEKDTATVLNDAGRAAFEKAIRARLEATSQDPSGWEFRRASDVLRAIYLAQRNISAYVSHAERTGLTAADCVSVANMLAVSSPATALEWVERGLALKTATRFRSGAAYDLNCLRKKLLVVLGRGHEALEAAWADFRKHPSDPMYDALMEFVPEAERAEWHEKAMNAAGTADLSSALQLFVETGEQGRLAELVRGASDTALIELSHHVTEPAARKLEESHPALAARLWRAQGIRILDARKSKYYDVALDNLERARDCYRRAGLDEDWENTVQQVCGAHFRKAWFIREFRAIAAGAVRGKSPSFLEEAKQRWKGSLE